MATSGGANFSVMTVPPRRTFARKWYRPVSAETGGPYCANRVPGRTLGGTTASQRTQVPGVAAHAVQRESPPGTQLSPSARRRAPRFVGSALLWLISLNAREQFFFQPCLALLELLNCRLVTNFGLVTLEKVDDVAVLVTKRVEAFVRRQ